MPCSDARKPQIIKFVSGIFLFFPSVEGVRPG